MDDIMPTFDREIAKQAERMLIRPRAIDYRTGVFASEVTPGVVGEKVREGEGGRRGGRERCWSNDGNIPYTSMAYDMRPFYTAIRRND